MVVELEFVRGLITEPSLLVKFAALRLFKDELVLFEAVVLVLNEAVRLSRDEVLVL